MKFINQVIKIKQKKNCEIVRELKNILYKIDNEKIFNLFVSFFCEIYYLNKIIINFNILIF